MRAHTKADPGEVRRLFKKGLGVTEISKIMGVHQSTISKRITVLGLKQVKPLQPAFGLPKIQDHRDFLSEGLE